MPPVNISRTLGYTPQNGVRYTHTVENSTEYTDPLLPNNTYFLDKALGMILFKDSTGAIRELYPAGLGFTAENVANKSNDATLGGATPSTTLYPTQNAVKTYADNILGNANALVYKGVIDCSTNPNYPAANAGELYIANGVGKIGGASGVDVEVGDMIICNTDGTVSGNQATVGTNWNVIQKNIVGAVSGPASSTNNNVAFFDGTTGKLIKDSGITLSGTNTGDETNSSIISKLGYTPEDVANKQSNLVASTTKYPTVDAVNTGLSAKVNTGAITGSGLTMATSRLLGRTTAGTAGVEEISVGSGLSLSGGILSSTAGPVTPFKTATLNFSTGKLVTVANSSTYVIPGNANYAPILLANYGSRHNVRTPIAGFVRSVQISTFIQDSFAGTGWNGTFRIHNLTTLGSTDIVTGYSFATGAYINNSRNDHYPLTSALVVNEGDELQIRLIGATSGTAPAGCYFTAQVYITE